jgi:MtN3 and saliva related transmembrane protein
MVFLFKVTMDPFYIGVGAGIFTAASLVPQLIKILKEKKAEAISVGMLLILLLGIGGWILYGVVKKDVPILVTNSFSFIINVLIIIFSKKYKRK